MAEPWSRLECEAIVTDYFEMLGKEARGETYSKSEHRRILKPKLNDRSDGSIEYKHQNISAALLRAGHAYVNGYKPAWNYQSLLEDVVLSYLDNRDELISTIEESLIEAPDNTEHVTDWSKVFVNAPERQEVQMVRESTRPQPRIVNFAERERQNRKLGERGEAFVLELERERLRTLGCTDLADEIKWTSKEEGDGAGYDIRSFKDASEEEFYIEVKTTNLGIYQPFLITSNEVRFSAENAKSYSLYRLFDFSKKARVYQLQGQIDQHVSLIPKVYSASFY